MQSTIILLYCSVLSEKAIVTNLPGTTRDIVEADITVGGVPVTLLDTTGFRQTNDVVEKIGVQRSETVASSADIIVMTTVSAADGMDFRRRTNSGESTQYKAIRLLRQSVGFTYFYGTLRYQKNKRQRKQLVRAREAFLRLQSSIDGELPLDFWTSDLREAALSLGQITGEDTCRKKFCQHFW